MKLNTVKKLQILTEFTYLCLPHFFYLFNDCFVSKDGFLQLPPGFIHAWHGVRPYVVVHHWCLFISRRFLDLEFKDTLLQRLKNNKLPINPHYIIKKKFYDFYSIFFNYHIFFPFTDWKWIITYKTLYVVTTKLLYSDLQELSQFLLPHRKRFVLSKTLNINAIQSIYLALIPNQDI